jgi:MSHA biogenesis protein MshG
MPVFDYKGRNKQGELTAGKIDSINIQSVAGWLMSIGITPILITPQIEPRRMPKWLRQLGSGPAVSDVEVLLFTKQMGTMIRAGVPIMQALAGIQKSTSRERFADVIQMLRNDLDKGVELSGALARHPKYFSEYYVAMVRLGEGTGNLEEAFQRLFSQLEFEKHMKQKIKGALRYPTFVLLAIAIAIAILSLWVIPIFAKVYAGMKVQLPLLTRVLLGTSDFAVNYWWAVLAFIVLAMFGFRSWTSTKVGRYRWDKAKLKFPVFGGIITKATIARFAFTFASATRSGMPLVSAFSIVSRVVENAFYEERILQMRDGVERGDSILRVATTAGIFSPLELQMMAVGEETGNMDEMVEQVARMYQEEVDYEVSRLSETIEPLLLAAMGILVTILMLGIFLPLWDLGAAARKH